LQETQERTESVQSFISELFGISRDDARGRSNKWIISRHRSPRLLIPKNPTRRDQYLFERFEYLPEPERHIPLIISRLSTFSPRFRSRLLPKLLYDMVWHAWTKDPCLSMPPFPLEDFYSDDFLGLGSRDLSFLLPFNPNLQRTPPVTVARGGGDEHTNPS
jgi:hypothetical protein